MTVICCLWEERTGDHRSIRSGAAWEAKWLEEAAEGLSFSGGLRVNQVRVEAGVSDKGQLQGVTRGLINSDGDLTIKQWSWRGRQDPVCMKSFAFQAKVPLLPFPLKPLCGSCDVPHCLNHFSAPGSSRCLIISHPQWISFFAWLMACCGRPIS